MPGRSFRSTISGLTLAAVIALPLSAVWQPAAAQATPDHSGSVVPRHTKKVCGPAPAHVARCDSEVVTDSGGAPLASATPSQTAYSASDLQSAYQISGGGSGETVALVDAYDDVSAEADLGVYRSQYGLPACTTVNGCFRKVDQTGGTNYPSSDPSGAWEREISLDVDMVSAVCANCHILLVEASSNDTTDLYAAENTAANLGANGISNSWGTAELPSETSDDSMSFSHPGVAVTAAAGDLGFAGGVQFPSASPHVTAVGGTTLTRSPTPRGWSETAWSLTDSGCSTYEPKPSWQTDTGCSNRTVNDVSADADPNTGVSVYDSQSSGWLVLGGTSVGAPIIASIYASGGNPGVAPGYPYAHPGALNDIASGSDGSCSPSYLCTAGPGYDGPTGLGTPRGDLAFGGSSPAVVGVEGSDAALWVRHSPGSGFTGLGGILTGAPAIAVVPEASGPAEPMYVATGSDHRLYARTDTLDWQLLTNSPTYCLDNPAAAVTGGAGSATLTVACQGGDHALYTIQGPVNTGSLPSLTRWTGLGGILAAGPAVAAVGGNLTFLVDGTDGHVWSRTASTPFTQMPWECLGHPALATSGSTTTFACDGTDRALWFATNAGGVWSATQTLGGVLVDGPGVAATSGGTSFYVEGSDSALWQSFVPNGGSPTGWIGDGGLLRQGAGAVGLG